MFPQQTDDTVERLDKVRADPRTVDGRRRKSEIAVGCECVVSERARFGVVEQYVEQRSVARVCHRMSILSWGCTSRNLAAQLILRPSFAPAAWLYHFKIFTR